MKLFIKKIDGCSSCPNLYIKYGSWGHRSGYCGILNKYVSAIDDAVYDDKKYKMNYFDKIPEDCPLSDVSE